MRTIRYFKMFKENVPLVPGPNTVVFIFRPSHLVFNQMHIHIHIQLTWMIVYLSGTIFNTSTRFIHRMIITEVSIIPRMRASSGSQASLHIGVPRECF